MDKNNKEGGIILKFFATILTALATIAASAGSQACLYWFLDEPKMPKSLLEK